MARNITLIIGLAFTALVIGLLCLKACTNELVIYKLRYHIDETIPAEVCEPITIERVQTAALLIPMCKFEFISISSENCLLPVKPTIARIRTITKNDISTDESIRTYARTRHTVLDPEAYITVPDQDEPMPIGLAWRTEALLNPEINILADAHELSHVCGYHHVFEDGFFGLTKKTGHVLSSSKATVGFSTTGMSYAADELSEF